jgi:predicted nucleotidyltransferase component of viral defense system
MNRIKNVPASVIHRLRNRSRDLNRPFEYVLLHYAIERFLYRLGQSQHRGVFVLKGGLACLMLDPTFPRTTRDIDLLGYTENAVENVKALIIDVCQLETRDDGLTFDLDTLQAKAIRGQDQHGGVRVRLTARLGKTRLPMQIDCGFGDAVFPEAKLAEYPTSLEFPAPLLRVYPPETIIAEKVHAIVKLGLQNSRLKDFYDIWFLTETRAINGRALSGALVATFQRRETDLPSTLSELHVVDFRMGRAKLWSAFARKFHSETRIPEFSEVLERVQTLVSAPLEALAAGRTFEQSWVPATGWESATLN